MSQEACGLRNMATETEVTLKKKGRLFCAVMKERNTMQAPCNVQGGLDSPHEGNQKQLLYC